MMNELERVTLDNASFSAKKQQTSMTTKALTLTVKFLGKFSAHLMGTDSLVTRMSD